MKYFRNKNPHSFFMRGVNCRLFIFAILSCFIFSACSNKNSPFGFPGTTFENYEIEFDSSVFKNIYAFQDSISNFAGNPKLVLGNYQDIETRILLRFMNLPVVKIIDDPTITLYLNNKHNPQEYQLKLATLKSNLFAQNEATWLKYDATSTWDTPGGDFDEPTIFNYDFAENDTLNTFSFTIDKEIVQNWIDKPTESNFGIILFTENLSDSFIEFHSIETLARPTISINHIDADSVLQTEIRQVNQDTLIHDYKYADKMSAFPADRMSAFPADRMTTFPDLSISNIPPYSLYTQFEIDFEKEKDKFIANGVNSAEELKRINIVQAFIIYSVDEANSMTTNNRFNILVSIPHEYPFDINYAWIYPATTDSLHTNDFGNKEMRLNISYPMQQIISQNRPNNGILLLNSYHNMDYSHFALFGKEINNESLKPRLLLRYSVKIN